MKEVELKKVEKGKIGRIITNGVRLEAHEYDTVLCLAGRGLDIELVVPSGIPHSKNPDIEMLGAFWEMKAPNSGDRETMSRKFRKAVHQSGGKVVYDLRNIRNDVRKTEREVRRMFDTTRGMRRMILIKYNESGEEIVLDICK